MCMFICMSACVFTCACQPACPLIERMLMQTPCRNKQAQVLNQCAELFPDDIISSHRWISRKGFDDGSLVWCMKVQSMYWKYLGSQLKSMSLGRKRRGMKDYLAAMLETKVRAVACSSMQCFVPMISVCVALCRKRQLGYDTGGLALSHEAYQLAIVWHIRPRPQLLRC